MPEIGKYEVELAEEGTREAIEASKDPNILVEADGLHEVTLRCWWCNQPILKEERQYIQVPKHYQPQHAGRIILVERAKLKYILDKTEPSHNSGVRLFYHRIVHQALQNSARSDIEVPVMLCLARKCKRTVLRSLKKHGKGFKSTSESYGTGSGNGLWVPSGVR